MNKFNLFFISLSLLFFVSCNSSDTPSPVGDDLRLVFELSNDRCLGPTEPIDGQYRVTAVKGEKAYAFTCYGRNFKVIDLPDYEYSTEEFINTATLNGQRASVHKDPAVFKISNLNKAYTGIGTVVDQESTGNVHNFVGEILNIEKGFVIKVGSDLTEDFVYVSRFNRSATINGVPQNQTYSINNTATTRLDDTHTTIYLAYGEGNQKIVELTIEHLPF